MDARNIDYKNEQFAELQEVASTKKRQKIIRLDPTEELPYELILKIFNYCEDIRPHTLVSKSWRALSQDDSLFFENSKVLQKIINSLLTLFPEIGSKYKQLDSQKNDLTTWSEFIKTKWQIILNISKDLPEFKNFYSDLCLNYEKKSITFLKEVKKLIEVYLSLRRLENLYSGVCDCLNHDRIINDDWKDEFSYHYQKLKSPLEKIDYITTRLAIATPTVQEIKWSSTKFFTAYKPGLCLSRKHLDILPKEITYLKTIQHLRLSVELSEIPLEIGNLTNLTELSLFYNKLEFLPIEISNLIKLKSLDLSHNPLQKFPPAIPSLQELRSLTMSNTNLSFIPPEVGKLTNLRKLFLSQNNLTSIPSELGQLTNLKVIDLRCNFDLTFLPGIFIRFLRLKKLYLGQWASLKELSSSLKEPLDVLQEEIPTLTNLKELILRKTPNKLKIHESFTKLQQLTCLDLSDCGLEVFPPEISQLNQLKGLFLSGNVFHSFNGMDTLGQLEEFALSRGNLSSLPTELLNSDHLESLNLSRNPLKTFPSEICYLTNLNNIALKHAELVKIPSEISRLVSLTTLKFQGNKLTELPKEFCRLINLETLILKMNELEKIPSEISQLTNLYFLNLERNKLTEIPASLGQLTSLHCLYLKKNKLTEIPSQLCQLTDLDILHLKGNLLTSLPKELEGLPCKINKNVSFDSGCCLS